MIFLSLFFLEFIHHLNNDDHDHDDSKSKKSSTTTSISSSSKSNDEFWKNYDINKIHDPKHRHIRHNGKMFFF